MDPRIEDAKTRLSGEVRLVIIDIKAGPEAEPRPVYLADIARIKHGLDAPHGGAKTEILVNRQPASVVAGRLDDGDTIGKCWRKWLLHDCPDSAHCGLGSQIPVAVQARCNVNKVKRFGVKHGVNGRIGPRPELAGCRLSATPVDVANRNQIGTCLAQIRPGMQVVLRVKAASDHADPGTFLDIHLQLQSGMTGYAMILSY